MIRNKYLHRLGPVVYLKERVMCSVFIPCQFDSELLIGECSSPCLPLQAIRLPGTRRLVGEKGGGGGTRKSFSILQYDVTPLTLILGKLKKVPFSDNKSQLIEGQYIGFQCGEE